MATRLDNDVTLSHQDAESIAKMLGDYATQQAAHAQRTRSEAARAGYHADVRLARWLAARITERLYTWQDSPSRALSYGVRCARCGAYETACICSRDDRQLCECERELCAPGHDRCDLCYSEQAESRLDA